MRQLCAARRRFLQLTCLAVALALLTQSCSISNDPEISNKTLNRGLLGSPESLDPHKFSSSQAGNVLRDIGEGLVSYDAEGRIRGGIASHWDVSDDGLQYVFHLRPEARFSNGEPVFAEHFVYSFQRLVSPATGSPMAQNLAPISNAREIIAGENVSGSLGVSAINTLTLEITLRSSTPYFLQLMSHPSTFPVYPPNVEKFGDAFSRVESYVSSGAYYLADRKIGSEILLKRNPYYWDNENTWFDQVNYKINESAQEINRYRAGELDVTDSVDARHFQKMMEDRPDELKVSPYLAIYYYGFNMTNPTFRDSPELRKALSMAIDRNVLVSAVTRRGELPAFGWVPPGVHNYESQSLDFSRLSTEAREAEARALYAIAGYGPNNPLKLEIRYNTHGGHDLIALAIRSMWRDVLGVEAELVNEEFKVFISNVREMNVTDVFRLSWTAEYDDAYTFLQLLETGNPSNLTGYSNKFVVQEIQSAARETDLEARKLILEKAERLALADHPIIPLYYYVSKHLVRSDIVGWRPNALDFHYSRHLGRQSN